MKKEYVILNYESIINMLNREITIEKQIVSLDIEISIQEYKYLLNKYFIDEYNQYKVNLILHKIYKNISELLSIYNDFRSCYDYLIEDDHLHFNRRRRINFVEFRTYCEKHIRI